MIRHHRAVLIAGPPVLLLAAVVALTLLGPHLAPHPVEATIGTPWSSNPGLLGTDALGRDVWSRTLAGGTDLVRAAVPVGLLTTALGAALGLAATRLPPLGRAFGPVTAAALAVPGTVLTLCAAVFLPPDAAMTVSMLFLGVPISARIIHAAAVPLLGAEFIRAAERRGESTAYIVAGELLPALSGTVIADAAVRILAALQLLAGLHVLGFGPPPPAADWAMMIRENLPGVTLAPWSVGAPALALMLVSVTVALTLDVVAHTLAPGSSNRPGRLSIRRRSDGGHLLHVEELRLAHGRGASYTELLHVDRLTLRPGEILGVEGPSGIGKTTLVEALVGAARPTLTVEADIHTLVGRPLPRSVRARARLRREHIGWSEQDPARTLDRGRTVADAILDGRRNTRPVRELMQLLDIPERLAGERTSALSGGQAARVGVARALAGRPHIIVLDEPTAGLDTQTMEVVTDALRAFTDEGGALLVISHDSAWLHGFATRVVTVKDGVLMPCVHREPTGTERVDRRHAPGPLLREWTGLAVDVAGIPSTLPCDMRLHAGEIVALVAPSGRGKSTLLRAIGADRLPRALTVHGRGLPRAGDHRPTEVQLMIQDSVAALNPGRSLKAQVVRQARVVAGLNRAEAARAADRALSELGLSSGVTARRPGECSGGERQRAALARVLVTDARVLLLDEPTSALDPAATARVLRVLRRRVEAGGGAVLATHEDEVAAAACTVVRLPLPVREEQPDSVGVTTTAPSTP